MVSTSDRGAVGGEAQLAGKPFGIAGGGEEPLGLGGVVLVVLRALAELVDRQRPVLERGRHGGLTTPTPSSDRRR